LLALSLPFLFHFQPSRQRYCISRRASRDHGACLASTQRFYFNANRRYLILNLILAVSRSLYGAYIREKGSVKFEMESSSDDANQFMHTFEIKRFRSWMLPPLCQFTLKFLRERRTVPELTIDVYLSEFRKLCGTCPDSFSLACNDRRGERGQVFARIN